MLNLRVEVIFTLKSKEYVVINQKNKQLKYSVKSFVKITFLYKTKIFLNSFRKSKQNTNLN